MMNSKRHFGVVYDGVPLCFNDEMQVIEVNSMVLWRLARVSMYMYDPVNHCAFELCSSNIKVPLRFSALA